MQIDGHAIKFTQLLLRSERIECLKQQQECQVEEGLSPLLAPRNPIISNKAGRLSYSMFRHLIQDS